MVDPITHLNLNAIIPVVLILVFSSRYYGAEAQSTIQPASPFASPIVVWDVSSLCIITGSLIATLLLVFVFLMFLRRFTNSHSHVAESKCEGVTGIHPQLLQTFPILLYSSITKHLKEGPLQCAVCLADFNGGDTLRILPQCNHAFHPPCIDAWLSSHVTCPVCRADLNHQHSQLHFAISVDTETEDQTSGTGCGSEEGKRNSDEEDKGERESASKLKLLMRWNSTGHSVVELEDGECTVEKYTLRLPEDVKKCIMMQRSASYNIVESSMRGL